MNDTRPRYLSLFSGIGGFELGIGRRAVCVGFSEIDKHAAALYRRRFPDHRPLGDIAGIDPCRLPDFDLLCGGFPCQAFSIAGMRSGFGDARGVLFFEIARIARAKQPRLLFLENVRGLLAHHQGRTFGTILAALDELGYDLQWQVLNSKDFGVPQHRERVFIVGHLRGTPRPAVFPFRCADSEHLGARRLANRNGHFICRPVAAADRLVARYGRRLKPNLAPAHTLLTAEIPGIFNGACIRRFTPLECERLQGFPDGWTSGMSDTQRYKCLGNAVTVPVIAGITERLLS